MPDAPRLPVRIGTRGSPLALAQAQETRARLLGAHPGLTIGQIEIQVIQTTGDRVRDRPLSEIGGKGLFTKEIEEALLERRIDLAVHSMKDMPAELPEGLAILCLLEREDPRDVLISAKAQTIDALPQGATVGTSSLRRQALLLRARPDLRVITFRGNVQTRLARLDAGEADATLLALAGLRRLGLESISASVIPVLEMLPAVAQGAIGVEARAGDSAMARLLQPLNHLPTEYCVRAERAFLAALDGSCRTPLAALAEILPGDRLRLCGQIIRPDGSQLLEARREGALADAARMGFDAGVELRLRGGEDFFAASL
ncbi:MAG: hydroxymethylbilane synthase [Alphaproteobacteria bacterium]